MKNTLTRRTKMKLKINVIGLILLGLLLSACGGSGSNNDALDSTPPVMTLIGDSAMIIMLGSTYTEQGATAHDDVDGTVGVTISGSVDASTVAIYTITYSAIDSSGNSAEIHRLVSVFGLPDTTPPVISLIGDSVVSIIQGSTYTEQGATANDDVDGTIDVTVSGSVDTSTLGEYIIRYAATDSAGNSTEVFRTVNVINVPDTTPPVINLFGASEVIILQGSTYTEQGATANDDVDGQINVTVSGDVDSSTPAVYIISYTAIDSAGNSSEVFRTVSVEPLAPFITRWQTDNPGESDDNQIKISTSGSGYDYHVDWGDDSTTANVSADIIHTYAIPGTYTVTISGNFPRLYFNEGYDNDKLISIEQWGDQPWQSMNQAFFFCTNVTSNAVDSPNLSQVTDMSRMFANASAFNQDLSNWDVSAVTDMSFMFLGASVFNQDLSSWDVSAVTDMSFMFASAPAFNQDLSRWNVSAVANMSLMFQSASAFNQDLSRWNVSAVTNMGYMFSNASAFNHDLSSWDVSAVTDMGGMFGSASAFNQDLGNWNVSAVTDMRYMFSSASVFDQGLSNWDVSAVTNMSNMFKSASAFNQDLSSWDVSAVTNMSYMFSSASVFDQYLSNWDVSAVTNMSNMFSFASAFNQDLSSWDVSAVTYMSSMFSSALAFNQDLSSWDVSAVTTMSSMFSSALALNQDLSSWDVSAVTTMSSMFQSASVFNQDLSSWDVSAVTNMKYMFSHAAAFNQDLSSWDVSFVTDMGYMFRSSAFNQDLSSWDVSAVTNMPLMFESSPFNQDLSSWDVSAVINMGSMFASASTFNQDLSSWDVSNVTNMVGMFSHALAFNQDLSNWDISAVTDMSNMFSGSTLSTVNYDALLLGWSILPLQNDVEFDGGNSTYSSSYQSARDMLTNTFNWTISDGGVAI